MTIGSLVTQFSGGVDSARRICFGLTSQAIVAGLSECVCLCTFYRAFGRACLSVCIYECGCRLRAVSDECSAAWPGGRQRRGPAGESAVSVAEQAAESGAGIPSTSSHCLTGPPASGERPRCDKYTARTYGPSLSGGRGERGSRHAASEEWPPLRFV